MLRYFKYTSKGEVSDTPISLERVLAELENLPTENESQGSFLGFTLGYKTIQFIRIDEDLFIIDIPLLKNGEFSHSKQAELDLEKAKHIVEQFAESSEISDDILDPSYVYTSNVKNFEQLPREMRDSAIPSEYNEEIKCECGSSEFSGKRLEIDEIVLTCSKCSTEYIVKVDLSSKVDSVKPVITFRTRAQKF